MASKKNRLKSKKNVTSNIIQQWISCTKITVLCTNKIYQDSVNATLAKMNKAKSVIIFCTVELLLLFHLLCKSCLLQYLKRFCLCRVIQKRQLELHEHIFSCRCCMICLKFLPLVLDEVLIWGLSFLQAQLSVTECPETDSLLE